MEVSPLFVNLSLLCKRKQSKSESSEAEASTSKLVQTSGRLCAEMARGKIQMRRIENPVHRQVTFCKRRAGLLKKVKELSVLCDADIGIIIFSSHGKLYELATKGSMQDLIERYARAQGEDKIEGSNENLVQEPKQEVSMLKQEIGLLQKGLRYRYGEGPSHMTLDELLALERQLEMWMYYTRSAKMRIMFQEIELLKNKEGILKAANEILQEKPVNADCRTEWAFDVAPLTVDQNGFFNVAPQMIADTPYPLTIQNDMIPILGAAVCADCRTEWAFDVAPLTVDQNGFFNVAPQMIADTPYPLTIQNDMIPILGALY